MFNLFYILKGFFFKFMHFVFNKKSYRLMFNNSKFKVCNFSKKLVIMEEKVFWMLKNILIKPIYFMIFFCNSYNIKSADSFNFIFPKSDVMVGMIMLHDHLMFFIIMILTLKIVFLFSSLLYSRSWMNINYFPFGYKEGINKKKDVFYPGVLQFNDFKTFYNLYGKFEIDQFKHAVELEFIWTWVPALLLLIMAYPSFLLLYSTDQAPSYPLFNICCFGNQWFWSYEYMDFDTHLFAWDKIEDILKYDLSSTHQYHENSYKYLTSSLESNNIRLYNILTNKYYFFNIDNVFKFKSNSFNFKHPCLTFLEESINYRVFNAKLSILNNYFGNNIFYSTHKTLLFDTFFVGYNVEQPLLCTFNTTRNVKAFDLLTESMDSSITLDCQILGELDLPKGYPRLLSTDQVLVIPSDITVRFLITSADVIHSWALPSFGIKMDAVPGRLNQVFLKAPFCGTVWGQCSELRGINHGFMPIEIRVLPLWEFIYFIKLSLLNLTLDKITYFINNLAECESVLNIDMGFYTKYDSEYINEICTGGRLYVEDMDFTDEDYFMDLREFMVMPIVEVLDYFFNVEFWNKFNINESLDAYCGVFGVENPMELSDYICLEDKNGLYLYFDDSFKEYIFKQSLKGAKLDGIWDRVLPILLDVDTYMRYLDRCILFEIHGIEISPLEHFELKYFNSILFCNLQFNIDNFYIYYLGCIIFVFIVWLSFKFNRFSRILDNFLIWYFRFILELIKNQSNSWRNFRYLPLNYSIFLIIFVLNLFSLSPYTSSVSGHIMITLSLSLSLFIGIIFIGFLNNRENFFYFFVPSGVPKYLLAFLIIIEILSFLIRPFSLSIRLFANMLAGHTLLNIFGTFTCYVTKKNFFLVFIPFIFCLLICLLEFGVAIIQAYVFTILLVIYISDVTTITH